MLQLGQLLERFKGLTNTEKAKKQRIVEIFANNKLSVNINQISILKNTLFIKTPPITKTEILLKKEEILKEIQKIPGLTTISTIL